MEVSIFKLVLVLHVIYAVMNPALQSLTCGLKEHVGCANCMLALGIVGCGLAALRCLSLISHHSHHPSLEPQRGSSFSSSYTSIYTLKRT